MRVHGTWTPPELHPLPLVEFTYIVFTWMPGDSYCKPFSSLLLCLCDVFRAQINSLVCWVCTCALGLVLFQIVVYVEKIISAATEIQRWTTSCSVHTVENVAQYGRALNSLHNVKKWRLENESKSVAFLKDYIYFHWDMYPFSSVND